uniref:Uncharacterized protein n=1 Tax=Arundo donax TaxID=35708 RepID=A0A0A9EHT2_ARUDO
MEMLSNHRCCKEPYRC